MKSLISAVFLAFCMLGHLADAAEVPFDQSQFEHARDEGKPLAVVFHAWRCPTCRVQTPVIKELSQQAPLAALLRHATS